MTSVFRRFSTHQTVGKLRTLKAPGGRGLHSLAGLAVRWISSQLGTYMLVVFKPTKNKDK